MSLPTGLDFQTANICSMSDPAIAPPALEAPAPAHCAWPRSRTPWPTGCSGPCCRRSCSPSCATIARILFLGTTSALGRGADLFAANPLLGAFSDVYGRRLILLQSLAVSCACNLCVAASPTLATIVVAVRTRRTVRAKSQSEFGSCTPVRATGRLWPT